MRKRKSPNFKMRVLANSASSGAPRPRREEDKRKKRSERKERYFNCKELAVFETSLQSQVDPSIFSVRTNKGSKGGRGRKISKGIIKKIWPWRNEKKKKKER